MPGIAAIQKYVRRRVLVVSCKYPAFWGSFHGYYYLSHCDWIICNSFHWSREPCVQKGLQEKLSL